MKNLNGPTRLPVDVHEALEAIATTGKGRCWYCDARLPVAERAIGDGWDVQRIEDQPVASIILVCPECLPHELGPAASVAPAAPVAPGRNGSGRHLLSLQPKRA